MHKNENTQNSHSFLALGAFVYVGINEFEISIKFCIFWYPSIRDVQSFKNGTIDESQMGHKYTHARELFLPMTVHANFSTAKT